MAETRQNLCPICSEPFKVEEVIVDFERWGHAPEKAHLDCLLHLSAAQGGRAPQPPQRWFK